MAGKSLYKRAVDPWNEDVKFSPRAKENKMFEKLECEKVGSSNKSKTKGLPRSDHKHDYKPIIVWRKSLFGDNIIGYIGLRCCVCGKIKNSYANYFFGYKVKNYLGELEHFWRNEKDEFLPIDSKTYQKTVFVGGSKILNSLSTTTEEQLVDFMNLGHNIIIGDCFGTDLQMQKVLVENNYKKVTVYYSGDRVRVNLGNWKTKNISSNKFMSDYECQKLKDNQMAIDCDFGYILLADITEGTVANIKKLVELKKTCRVGLYNKKSVYDRDVTLQKEKDLEYINRYYD